MTPAAQPLYQFLPQVLAAFLLLIIGWLVAQIIYSLVKNALRTTSLDNRLAAWVMGKPQSAALPIENWLAQAAYYLVMLFVLVAFFQTLGLTLITEPLNSLLNQIFAYIPRLIGAGIILTVAWMIASLLKLITLRVAQTTRLESRLGAADIDIKASHDSLAKALAESVYWLIFLLFLPAVLDALALQGLLGPVQAMTNQILGFVPNLFAAGLILLIGWFAARIIQRISTNLLSATGLDRLAKQAGLSTVLGKQSLSTTLGTLVYVLILIPVAISALNALQLTAVTQPASRMLEQLLLAIPQLFAALLLVGAAYFAGRVAGQVVTTLLTNLGFNHLLTRIGLAKSARKGQRTLSQVAGYLTVALITLLAAIEAFRLLNFTTLADLLTQLIVSSGQILVGLVIFALGFHLANLARQAILDSRTHQAHLLATIARVSILIFTAAMALRQMGLASDIINLAFGLLLGSLAVTFALAFGLGGRTIAAKQLEQWSKSLKKAK
jgi:hypothetical protein